MKHTRLRCCNWSGCFVDHRFPLKYKRLLCLPSFQFPSLASVSVVQVLLSFIPSLSSFHGLLILDSGSHNHSFHSSITIQTRCISYQQSASLQQPSLRLYSRHLCPSLYLRRRLLQRISIIIRSTAKSSTEGTFVLRLVRLSIVIWRICHLQCYLRRLFHFSLSLFSGARAWAQFWCWMYSLFNCLLC